MGKPILISVALLLSTVASTQAATAQTAGPKINVHIHPAGAARSGYPCIGQTGCVTPPPAYTTDEEVMRGTFHQMDRHDIVLGFLTGAAGQAAWVEAAPSGRFLRGIAFSESQLTPPPDSFRVRIMREGYRFIGEVAPQYQGIAVDDPELDPYFAVAAETDTPVLIHMEGVGAPWSTFRAALGRPLMLEEVLKRHSGLRLYVENAGYPFGDDMIALLSMYPTVYADLSTITWAIPRPAFHDYLERFVRAGFADRLMFGSDHLSWPEVIDLAVEAIDTADFLTDGQKRDIFFNNAVRFFALDGEDLRTTGVPDPGEG